MIIVFIHLSVTYRQTIGCKAICSAWHLNLHRYRWQVRFWLYTMHVRLARRGAYPQRRSGARFTAFVSYCKEDSNFVLTKVSETFASVCSAERTATSCSPRSVKHLHLCVLLKGQQLRAHQVKEAKKFMLTMVSETLASVCSAARRLATSCSPRSVKHLHLCVLLKGQQLRAHQGQ